MKAEITTATELEFIKADWPAPIGIHALTSTRHAGVSEAAFASFNLAMHVNDDAGYVATNRQILHQQLNLPSAPVWLQQSHSNVVIQADQQSLDNIPEADASWTTVAGVVCAVLTADCLPVLFCHRDGRRVAAAHAGWRGLHNGVLSKTFNALLIPPEDCLVWLGPAIGADSFEVGHEVYQAFLERDPETAKAFVQRDESHWFCDVYQLARWELNSLGINNIYGGGLCTFSDAERFYSFRRDGDTGRMASLIWKE